MAVHGGKEMDLRERSVEAAKGLPDPGTLYLWENRPRGGGRWNIPLTCLLRFNQTLFST